tara:strand:- start:2810 stop:3286 length:477 start_codon:yes stop_codon:yes gene_type:complete
MTEAFYSSLLDFGMGGLFITFLVYNYISNQKRLDKQVCNFTDQLKEQNKQFREHLKEAQEKADLTEEKLRARYDKVIAGLNQEKLDFNTSLLDRANDAMREFNQTKSDLENLKIKTDSLEVLNRDCLFILQRLDEILKSQDEERKLKAMAKRMNRERE